MNSKQDDSDYYKIERIYKSHRNQFERFYSYSIPLKLNLKQIINTILPFNITQKRKGIWIFVACIPKSGSTYITNKIANITGFRFKRPIAYFLDIEQNIDIRMISRLHHGNIVCQMHTPGKLFNIEIMKKFQIKPIILIRDPRDVVLSMHDHMYKEAPLTSFGRLVPEWYKLKYDERIEYLLYHFLPSIIAWFRSWLDNKNLIKHLIIKFEDLLISNETKKNLFKKILKFYNLDYSNEALKKLDTDRKEEIRRKNVAVLDRWKSEMDSDNLKLFKKIAGNTLELMGYE